MIVLTTVTSAADLARALLGDPKTVLAAPPDGALAELAIAAAKCLSHADYTRLATGDPRLRDRVAWLLSGDAQARFPATALGPLSEMEFAALKECAGRVVVVTEPLEDFLASLPDRWLDRAHIDSSVSSSLRRQILRVARRVSA